MNISKTGTDRPTQKSQQVPAAATTLVERYGRIGISAVAAAVRYQGAAKNPAYAPVSSKNMLEWAAAATA